MIGAGAASAADDQARHAVGTRPTAAATPAAAVAARAYALNDQPEQAPAALKAADALMGRLTEGERSDTGSTYGEQKHHVHLSHALTTRKPPCRRVGTGQASQGGNRLVSLRRAFSRAA